MNMRFSLFGFPFWGVPTISVKTGCSRFFSLFPMARNMTHLKKILTTLCSIMIGSAQGSSVFRWISNSISPSQVIRLYFSHLFKIYNDICKRRSCLVHDSWDVCFFIKSIVNYLFGKEYFWLPSYSYKDEEFLFSLIYITHIYCTFHALLSAPRG